MELVSMEFYNLASTILLPIFRLHSITTKLFPPTNQHIVFDDANGDYPRVLKGIQEIMYFETPSEKYGPIWPKTFEDTLRILKTKYTKDLERLMGQVIDEPFFDTVLKRCYRSDEKARKMIAFTNEALLNR
jgi:hypothetical protein